MSSLQERIAAYAHMSANLLTQLNELDELRERVRKAQLSFTMPKPLKQRPISVNRRPPRLSYHRRLSRRAWAARQWRSRDAMSG